MPPGGETSRFFVPLGENAPCTRQAECLPYSKKGPCSEIYKHQFVELLMIPNPTRRDSLIVNCQL